MLSRSTALILTGELSWIFWGISRKKFFGEIRMVTKKGEKTQSKSGGRDTLPSLGTRSGRQRGGQEVGRGWDPCSLHGPQGGAGRPEQECLWHGP